ncbi:hypothetical protein JMJ35_010589 [Cladonia borealis]|uniref:Methyltransferase domain-containing protein n=1 Tax=Cladonia borealis TaxID=184061 RepID=A0AA39QR39_9LECA|nr:hypothetical protein JMJ35_010589 [Cladonia borealis]
MAAQSKPFRIADDVSRSRNIPWFQSKIGSSLTPAGRSLLEIYSGIPASEVEAHIYDTRDSVWEIFPWPCVGEFWFVTLGLSQHPQYDTLLTRLRNQTPPTKFLDLGCCLGQDLRKLVHDGAPLEALWGSDYFAKYEGAGQEFFRDKDRFQNRFIAADLFDESPDSGLVPTAGTWDVISIVMFLHMYDWNRQVQCCRQILKLLSKSKGSMVIGAQTGAIDAEEVVLKPPYVAEGEERTVFRHNIKTFTRMWQEVGNEVGVQLDISVVYDHQADRERRVKEEQGGGKDKFFSGATHRRLCFTVTIA